MKKVYDQPDIPPHLLAKSPRYDDNGCLKEGCLLVRHTLDVVAAARDLIKVLGSDLQKFFKLSEDQMPRLITTSKLAAFFHDIGKANDGFVAMLNKRGRPQSIRHEHLSAVLMSHPPLREWLLQRDKDVQDSTIGQTDYEIARLVVAGYHLKTAIRLNTNPRFVGFAQKMPGASSDKIIVYSTHGQFLEWLELLSKEFGLSPRDFEIPPTWSFSSTARTAEHVQKHAKRIVGDFGHYCAQVRRQLEDGDWSTMRLLMSVKAILIAADAAASAMRRKGLSLETWIKDSFNVCASVDDLEELKKKYIAGVETRQRKKKGQENYKFGEREVQKETAKLGARAALVSSCGSGKTYAGYLWAQKQIENCGLKRKVIFLYPTTNTAAQGFKDYASHESKATLITSRAEFDLEGMFKNPDDEMDDRHRNDYTTDKELFALAHWDRSICIATVDAFLSFMQNGYASLCLLPVLTRSVVVIDEVHSFDYAMFAALIEFLERFDVPVLLMSASLPEERRKRLRGKLPDRAVYPEEKDFINLPDLTDAMKLDRYQVFYDMNAWKASDDILCPPYLLEKAQQEINRDQKVLWVVNTVDRCIGIARALEQQNPLCYHSRFVYEHRRNTHEAIVDKFQPENESGVIAVTTQVCEMSLDLDADILITELAPATSLIQRMGRCNRQEKGRKGKPGQVFIYQTPTKNGRPDHNPYRAELFQTGDELISELKLKDGILISQKKLADKLDSIGMVEEPNKLCKFTTPDWVSTSENDFRDTDEFTVPAVLESDKDEFYRRKKTRGSITGLLIQAPVRYTEKVDGTWVRLVPTITKADRYDYSERYGLREV